MKKKHLAYLLWLIPLLFLLVFYFYPVSKIFLVSFERAGGSIGQVLEQAWASSAVRKAVGFTFWQATLSTILTLLVGLPGAYLFGRYTFRGKKLLRALTGVPFVMPTLVVAAAFDALLGARGWLNLGLMQAFNLSEPPIELTNTLAAILLAHIFYNTTIVLRIVGDFWANLDPRLTQAAKVLGASPRRAWLTVTLPLLAPAVLAAALLVFIFDFTSFGVILILGGPGFSTIETEIYYQAVSLFNLPLATTLAGLQIAVTLTLTAIYTTLINRLSRPINLRPQSQTQKPLRSWQQRVLAGVLVTFMLVLFISPLASLGARSFLRLEPEYRQRNPQEPGLTFDFYTALWENQNDSLFYAVPGEALLTSLGYAGATVVFSLLLGLPAAARWSGSSSHRIVLRPSRRQIRRHFELAPLRRTDADRRRDGPGGGLPLYSDHPGPDSLSRPGGTGVGHGP